MRRTLQRSLFPGVVVILLCAPAANAGSITFTDTVDLNPTGIAAFVSILGSFNGVPTADSAALGLVANTNAFADLGLPPGATLTSALLDVSALTPSIAISASQLSIACAFVDCSGPLATMDVTPPDGGVAVALQGVRVGSTILNFSSTATTLDLLALGLGPELFQNPLRLQPFGTVSWDFVPILTSPGSTNVTQFLVNLNGPAVTLNLAVDYTTAPPATPAPEPRTLALFGSGLLAVAAHVRRKVRPLRLKPT